jgi:hypothetical protein
MHKISHSWVDVLIFLCPFIWNRVSGLMWFHNGSNSKCALDSVHIWGDTFDTYEVVEAESQAVLNTLTEHDFQDAFKKCQKHWERCILAEGVASNPSKPVSLVFDQMTAPVPEIMDDYNFCQCLFKNVSWKCTMYSYSLNIITRIKTDSSFSNYLVAVMANFVVFVFVCKW